MFLQKLTIKTRRSEDKSEEQKISSKKFKSIFFLKNGIESLGGRHPKNRLRSHRENNLPGKTIIFFQSTFYFHRVRFKHLRLLIFCYFSFSKSVLLY